MAHMGWNWCREARLDLSKRHDGWLYQRRWLLVEAKKVARWCWPYDVGGLSDSPKDHFAFFRRCSMDSPARSRWADDGDG